VDDNYPLVIISNELYIKNKLWPSYAYQKKKRILIYRPYYRPSSRSTKCNKNQLGGGGGGGGDGLLMVCVSAMPVLKLNKLLRDIYLNG
ncbi:hypothetical protein ACXWQS_09400, partial [Streptococcus pyogenes]